MTASKICTKAIILFILSSTVLLVTPCKGHEVADEPRSAGLVVVIRALAGYWPGCDEYCQRVRNYGEHVVVYANGNVALSETENLVAKVRSGRWSHLRIVGYSLGADAAIELSRKLQQYEITVERLILIEATNPEKVSSNVCYCFNAFESRPKTDWIPILRGIQVDRESASTCLINYDVRKVDPKFTRLNHLTFSADPDMQTLIAFQAGAHSKKTCNH